LGASTRVAPVTASRLVFVRSEAFLPTQYASIAFIDVNHGVVDWAFSFMLAE